MKQAAETGSWRLLARLGLRTKEQRAWAMYDWANSAMVTIVVTAVYPIFFLSSAADGLSGEVATFRHVVGGLLLLLVNVEEGQRTAREAERATEGR